MSEKYWAVRKNLHSYIYIYAFTKISSSGSKIDGGGGGTNPISTVATCSSTARMLKTSDPFL